jgi:hypothetical protein
MEYAYKIFVRKYEGKRPVRDEDRDGTIRLYWSKFYRGFGSMQLIQYGV